MNQHAFSKISVLIILLVSLASPRKAESEDIKFARLGILGVTDIEYPGRYFLASFAILIPLSDFKITELSREECTGAHQSDRYLTLKIPTKHRIQLAATHINTKKAYIELLTLLNELGGEASYPYYITQGQMKKALKQLRSQNSQIEPLDLPIPETKGTLCLRENAAFFPIKIEFKNEPILNFTLEVTINKELEATDANIIDIEVTMPGVKKIEGKLELERVYRNEKSVKNFLLGIKKYMNKEEDSLEEDSLEDDERVEEQ